MMEDIILEVENLRTSFITDTDSVQSVRGITFRAGRGESLGAVRESDCGEGVIILSIMGLLEGDVSRQANVLLFDGEDLLKKSPEEIREIQGDRIDMIFQDPMTSLNPLFTVGEQIREPPMRHQRLSRRKVKTEALAVPEAVELPSPERKLKQYPRESLGGIRQRVMIVITMYCRPKLLIADEPTTTLDVTIQAQILELVAHMKNEFNASVTLITHDLGVISSLCTRVTATHRGLIMEEGNIEDVFYRIGHLYAARLLASIPERIKEKLVSTFDTPPGLLNSPRGCPFVTRCSRAMKLYVVRQPPFCDLGDGHINVCQLHNEPVKTRMGEMKL